MSSAQNFFAPQGAPAPLGARQPLMPQTVEPGIMMSDLARMPMIDPRTGQMQPNPMADTAASILPQQMQVPASAFFTQANMAPYQAAQQGAIDDARIMDGLKKKVEYAPAIYSKPYDMSAAPGYIPASAVGVTDKPNALGVRVDSLTPEEYGLVTNPRKDYAQEQQKAAQEAYQQRREMARSAAVVYKNQGHKELRQNAFLMPEGPMPAALTKKIERGEVISGAQLPPWLRRGAPGVEKLYWYKSQLSPEVQKLMEQLSPKPAQSEKQKPEQPRKQKVTQDG